MTTIIDPYDILKSPDELNDAQKNEISDRPLSNSHREFTEEQIKTRIEIGKILTKKTYEDCLQYHDNDIAQQYLNYPPYFYFTDKNHVVKRRFYGFGKTDSGDIIAHAVTAMIMINNVPTGGVNVNDCVLIDKWSPEQHSFLTSGLVNGAGMFTDPLGFMLMI